MPAIYSPRAVKELNVALVHCFQEGASAAVTKLQDLYSADGKALSTAMDLVRRVTIDTDEAVFLYPEMSFNIADFGAGDSSTEEGIKLYEHRQKSGNIKGKLISVPLTSFMDDKIDAMRVIFYKHGGAMVRSPLRLIEQTLHAACTGTTITSGIDGKPLFSTQHVQKPGEAYHSDRNPYVSNDITQSEGMSFANFATLYSKFLAIPDEDGVPDEGNVPEFLWFDPDYLGVAMDICHMDRPSALSGGGNPWRGKVKPMPVRRLQGTGQWGLAGGDDVDRPMNYVEREALQLRGLYTSPDDPYVRRNRRLEWMVDGRMSCGAGHYRRIIRSRKS